MNVSWNDSFLCLTLFVNGHCHNTVALVNMNKIISQRALINLRPTRINPCGCKDKMMPKANPWPASQEDGFFPSLSLQHLLGISSDVSVKPSKLLPFSLPLLT